MVTAYSNLCLTVDLPSAERSASCVQHPCHGFDLESDSMSWPVQLSPPSPCNCQWQHDELREMFVFHGPYTVKPGRHVCNRLPKAWHTWRTVGGQDRSFWQWILQLEKRHWSPLMLVAWCTVHRSNGCKLDISVSGKQNLQQLLSFHLSLVISITQYKVFSHRVRRPVSSLLSSFVTKWDRHISRERFDRESPNFTLTFTPVGSTTVPDMRSYVLPVGSYPP